MPSRGPIHLLEDDDKKNALTPKVTRGIVVSEIIRTVALAGAAGTQICSAIWVKKHSRHSENEWRLPKRVDLKVWFALGSWQFQVASGACLVSIASVYVVDN
jgi:hypothetical protein